MSSGIKTIDLFAGAGGSVIGSVQAGHEVGVVVEWDKFACETLRSNQRDHGAEVIQDDVSNFSGKELRSRAGVSKSEALIVSGGPPCQPFSKNSYWTDSGDDAKYRRARSKGEKAEKPAPITTAKEDSRRDMLFEFLRICVESKADAFVFENVPSIVHPRNKKTFERLVKAFSSEGFETNFCVLNASEFGVAQNRKRMVMIGSRARKPLLPQPTHSAESGEMILSPLVSSSDAISKFGSKKYKEDGEEVSGRWADQFFEVPPGMNYKALTAWAGHPNPSFEAETRFWNFLLKLHPDRPSWTIAASPGPWTGPFHWNNRRLRTPELAALQGFPEGYNFEGSRRERVRQIGNAMPPALARVAVDEAARSIDCSLALVS